MYFLQFRSNGSSIETETRFGLNTGGGLEYFFNRSVALKGEGRYHAVTNARGLDPSGIALTAGLKIYSKEKGRLSIPNFNAQLPRPGEQSRAFLGVGIWGLGVDGFFTTLPFRRQKLRLADARMMHLSRRHFLAMTAAAVLQPRNAGVRPEMIVRSARPEDREMALEGFSTTSHRLDQFFVRSHVYTPRVDVDTWRLTIDGQVDSPLTDEPIFGGCRPRKS